MDTLATAIANVDAAVVLRVLVIGLGVSLLVAVLQGALRQAIWSVWHLAATFFGFLARVTLTFVGFVTRLIAEAIDGLAEEGQALDGLGSISARPWVGWLIVGPLVYCALMLTFMASDLTVAILIFEAMGLTLGTTVRSTLPIPLDAAMGVVFVALAVFWGIVYFDVLGVTPFSYIWRRLSAVQRRRLGWIVLACLCVTVVAAMAMGLWSQAQLRGGLPEPWQTVLPWFIRGVLVSLLICATAVSGKPFGSALTAAFVLALLLVRAAAYLALAVLRLAVVILRESARVVLALVALVAHIGRALWNWCAGFTWAERAHIATLGSPELGEVGGDINQPETFGSFDAGVATLEQNKEVVRRLYEEAVLSAEPARLDALVAADVVHHDPRLGRVIGPRVLTDLGEHLLSTYEGVRVHIDHQLAQNDRVATRFTIEAKHNGAAVALRGMDESKLRDGKIVERWGYLDEARAVEPRDGQPRWSAQPQRVGGLSGDRPSHQ